MKLKKFLSLIIFSFLVVNIYSYEYDFEHLKNIKISSDVHIQTWITDGSVIYPEPSQSLRRFESKKLKQKKISFISRIKLVNLLKEIFMQAEFKDSYILPAYKLDMSFLDEFFEGSGKETPEEDVQEEEETVYINDIYVDVCAVIYLENKDGSIHKIAVGSLRSIQKYALYETKIKLPFSYIRIDDHYYIIPLKFYYKLIQFIQDEVKTEKVLFECREKYFKNPIMLYFLRNDDKDTHPCKEVGIEISSEDSEMIFGKEVFFKRGRYYTEFNEIHFENSKDYFKFKVLKHNEKYLTLVSEKGLVLFFK